MRAMISLVHYCYRQHFSWLSFIPLQQEKWPCCFISPWCIKVQIPQSSSSETWDHSWYHTGGGIGVPCYNMERVEVSARHSVFAVMGEGRTLSLLQCLNGIEWLKCIFLGCPFLGHLVREDILWLLLVFLLCFVFYLHSGVARLLTSSALSLEYMKWEENRTNSPLYCSLGPKVPI